MSRIRRPLVGAAFCAAALWAGSPLDLAAQQKQSGGFPWASGEKLVYRLLWPSGLSMGEATLQASFSGGKAHLQASVDAKLPQHKVSYSFSSVATPELCSHQFRQTVHEGGRNWEESFEFDPQTRQVRRTRGRQTSVAPAPECARDPLAFLYYFRQQLGLGKPMEGAAFHLGTSFPVRIEALMAETVKLGAREWLGERFLVTYTDAGREKSLEVWVRPDAARVPVGAKAPFPLATFAAELQ